MGKVNTGYIRQLPNGTYKVILEYPPVNGRRTKKTKTCKTKSEAKRVLIDMNLQKELHIKNQKAGIVSFKEAMDNYHNDLVSKVAIGNLKEKTLMDYEGILNRLLNKFKYTTLNQLAKEGVIDNYYKELILKEHLSGAYIAKLNIVLRGIFNKTSISYPEITFKYNTKKTRGNKVHPFSNDELKALNEYLKEHLSILTFIYIFTLTTGCRIGEVVGLKWNCLKPDEDIIEIKNTLIYISGKGLIEETPKTVESQRRLVVPHSLFKVLLVDLKNYYKTHNIDKGRSTLLNDNYVFTTKNNTPISPRNLLRDWQKVCSKAGLKEHHTFHDLRHTNITLKIANGVDVKTVSIMAGHADISVTLNTYSHYWKEAAQKAANIFSNIPTIFGIH